MKEIRIFCNKEFDSISWIVMIIVEENSTYLILPFYWLFVKGFLIKPRMFPPIIQSPLAHI